MSYQPTAGLDAAYLRAQLYADIRRFFASKGVLEVDTPILNHTTATEPHLASVCTRHELHGKMQQGFLQTSPEFAMKRLVAAWGEPIFQICKAFRDGEAGARHNPEFTLLEWYRPSFTLQHLMDELAELLSTVFNANVVLSRISYAQALMDYADVEPFTATAQELEQVAILNNIDINIANTTSTDADSEADTSSKLNDTELKQTWLDVLFTHLVEPKLGHDVPTVVFDFPADQASLAKVLKNDDGFMVAKRFELFINGLELANAYQELTDSDTQRHRFYADNQARQAKGLPQIPVDDNLLEALKDMPDCSGIALGLDRLLMLLGKYQHIHDVIHFPISQL